MIYLDTSALAKLVVRETETAALTGWLEGKTALVWATSAVGHIELLRLAARYDATDVAVQLLSGLDTIPLGDHVAELAATVRPATLRALDAVHLASAISVRGELSAFCCYDQRLLSAAQVAGLPVAVPTG